MRTFINLKFTLIIASLLLIVLGFSACGSQPANNAVKPNTNGTNANINANSAADPKAAAAVCSAAKDAAITKFIVDGVNTDPDLLSRKKHINAFSYGCNVSLVGYLDDIKYFKKFYDLASKNSDVQKVDISGLWLTAADAEKPTNGACPNNGVKCNDICLPEGQVCNMVVADVVPTGSPK